MTTTVDDDLSERLGAAILATAPDSDVLALVARVAEAEVVVRDLLHQSVSAARSAGHSWAAVGAELDMSRQAAQQRFGATEAGGQGDDRERWLGPVTAFDEMSELEMAGRLGWHTVEAGMLRHRMVRTDTQWEHKRILWPRSFQSYERDGWQIGCRAFPWVYLIRETGLPAETEAGG
ncbi:MAG TPA: hypothetical protein VIW94_01265 [Acidimicrobiia bacterium]